MFIELVGAIHGETMVINVNNIIAISKQKEHTAILAVGVEGTFEVIESYELIVNCLNEKGLLI